MECLETKPDKKSKHLWLTNFPISPNNVDTLANSGGRLRWKVENEGFNVQKNGGYNLEHSYSRDQNARKVFYLLLQLAHMVFQLTEKGSLFRKRKWSSQRSRQTSLFSLLSSPYDNGQVAWTSMSNEDV